MTKLKFGIIWIILVNIIFSFILLATDPKHGESEMNLGIYLFIILFEAVGIWMLISGAKIVIKDKKTDKYGKLTYGKVIELHGTGVFVNNVPEVAAKIATYIPENGDVKVFSEIIGVGNLSLLPGMYVLLKHFEDDVNIIQIIREGSVPINALDRINSMFPSNAENKVLEVLAKMREIQAARKLNSNQNNNPEKNENNDVIKFN